MIKLIEKIEGEAKLHFSFKQNKIDFVNIEFLSTRNIEEILQGKPILDALVINPRVCGICGHAHLIATVLAIENCYSNIQITQKAKYLRELTLNFELIQNHFKWFYLTIMPLFGYKQYVLKATKPSQFMAKAISIIAGQYPHNSYAIVGGVTCEVTNLDLIKIEQYISETINEFKNNLLNIDINKLNNCNLNDIINKDGDLMKILNHIKNNNYENLGKSYDRFICFSNNSSFKKSKILNSKICENLDLKYIFENINKNSYAKNVMYKDKYYEVGPLSRAMINNNKLIKSGHRLYKDSMFTRILARVNEIALLLNQSKIIIKKIDLSQESYIKPDIDVQKLSGYGESAVEAARGSLVHKVMIKNGIIKKYDIITPTQWNLSNGTKDNPGVSQKAMINCDNENIAQKVFKSFDVCSVCTTH